MAAPLRAKSISCGHCEHGSLFVYLHDAGGDIIALAAMDLENAADFLDDFGKSCEAALALVESGEASMAPEVH